MSRRRTAVRGTPAAAVLSGGIRGWRPEPATTGLPLYRERRAEALCTLVRGMLAIAERASVVRTEFGHLTPQCAGCRHGKHLGMCSGRNGGTAYHCPCYLSTP